MENRLIEPLPLEELERRWRIAESMMAELELDALVLQNSNDWLGGYVRWFSGAPANNAYPRSLVFFGSGDMGVVEQGPEGGRKIPATSDPVWRGVRDVRYYPSYTTAGYSVEADARLIADMLAERGARKIGWVNPAGAYFGFGRALETMHGAAKFVDVTDRIDLAKAVKSPIEQALIRRTAALQDEVMLEVAGFIRPGLRDFEVAAFAQYQAARRGAEQGIYISSSSPHGAPAVFRPPHLQGRRMEQGDVFSLLVETNGPGGYYCEIARAFSLGRASTELRSAVQAAIDAQAWSLDRLRDGATPRSVADANDSFLAARGQGPERRLYCHGQGYDMVERPLIRANEDMIVREGMNIVVHPGVVTAAANGLVCDNYLIGPDGPGECLHRTEKGVWEI